MIIIILITIAAILLVPEDKKDEAENPLPPAGITEQEKQTAGMVLPDGQKEGDHARNFIAELNNNPAAAGMAYAEANKQQQQGKLADAYILYFFAGRKKHIEAALALGTMADPEYFSAGNSMADAADVRQANKWYGVAAASGSEEALKRLTKLRKQVEADAADGDSAAARLMLQWK